MKSLKWRNVKIEIPTEYGRYEVYRAGCKKQHYETWNNTGWAYNNNDITHWRNIISPFEINYENTLGEAEEINIKFKSTLQKVDGKSIIPNGQDAVAFIIVALKNMKKNKGKDNLSL
jgi:uncharacterized protein YpuA (DUF1002 family)